MTLTGVATAAPCQLNPSSLDFDSVTVGQNDVRSFTLTNTGGVTLSGTLTESCPDFAILSPPSYSLAGGQSATFSVRFAPSSAGAQPCTINTGSAGCPSLVCSGTGIPVTADCQVTPSALGFGEVAIGSFLDGTFTIRNAGSTRLTGFVSESCPEFSLPGQTTYDLAPGASQSFIVRFSPSVQGSKICTVNTGTGCPALTVTGIGIVGCALAPTALDFGYVRFREAGYRTFTLTNNTNQQLTGNLISAGPFTARTQSGSTSFSVPPHHSALIGVSFQPSSGCDTVLYQEVIRTDNPTCNQVQVRGIGTYGCDCEVLTPTLGFGDVVVGTASGVAGLHIRNSTRLRGASGAVRVLSGEFVADPTYRCPSPPSTCTTCTATIAVRFRPTKLGPQTGKIVVERPVECFGPGAPCDTVTCTGTGVSAAVGDMRR